jgi:hypothetical protein
MMGCSPFTRIQGMRDHSLAQEAHELHEWFVAGSIVIALMRFKGIPTPKGKYHQFNRGTDSGAN